MSDSEKVLWPGWETVRLIGRGSFGAVYEIERDMLGEMEKAALKVITIPQSSSDIDELYSEGFDDESITSTFKSYLKSIVAEYSLMRKMNGSANVVNCDDIRYVQHDDGFGWDIFIKMELLTPLTKALGRDIPYEQVERIGTDICKALILCKKHNIIHRDIKPANIFVSENGDYKLGDFGIAKTVEKTSGGTKIGTYEYMAPEVYHDQPYGSTVDIYSLGMVLYWLLNERRTPFLKMPPALPTNSEKEQARKRRFNGEPIPAPAHGSEELKRIVLKACAYDPKDRYQTADEMLRELNAIGAPVSASAAQPVADDSRFVETSEEDNATVGAWAAPAAAPQNADDDATESTVGVWSTRAKSAEEKTTQAEERTVGVWDKPEAQKQKPAPAPKKPKKKGWLAAVAAVAVLVAAFGAMILLPAATNGSKAPVGAVLTHKAEIVAISAGGAHTVGLKSNGTVVATGSNISGQCFVYSWSDIIAVSVGNGCTLGLKSDGTVVTTGGNDAFSRDVSNLEDIIAVSVEGGHAVGLKSDGTVVAVGSNEYGQCDVSDWNDIISVSAGDLHTVGLKSDGTVIAAGENDHGQCDVSDWNDIVSVSAGYDYTVGLKSDGTVVTTGDNTLGRCDVADWKDIIAISAGNYHTVGLRSDGTVVAAGYNNAGQCDVSDWRDIVSVSAGGFHTVGLKSDGTAVAVGDNSNGRCDVSNW